MPSFIDHVIVVDDGSTDGTAHRIVELQHSKVLLIQQLARRGVGIALIAGFQKALAYDCAVCVVMDGDGQMDPNDLEALLEPLVKGEADCTKGDRFRRAETYAIMPKLRLVGNLFLTYCTKLASGLWHINDAQCGYLAITRRALETIELKIKGMDCEACAGVIRNKLLETPGVAGAEVHYPAGHAVVRYDAARVTPDELLAAVKSAGYSATPADEN